MFKNRPSKLLLAGAIASGCMCTAANAALNIDLRATGVTGAGTFVNSKSVIFVEPGSVVRFDIFAVVTGTNANLTDDQIVSVRGSLKSSVSGSFAVRGNLAAGLVATAASPPVNGFDGVGSSVGLEQDLDGDGDIDIGSNNNSDPNNFWAPVYVLAPSGANAPSSFGCKIGFGTFTVTSAPPDMGFGPSTDINFRGGAIGANAAKYIQDGVTVDLGVSSDGLVALNVRGRFPIPEPASLGFASLGALSLVRHRRD